MEDKNLIPISPSETEIYQIVWKLQNATVQEVCDELPESRKIAYATVQTLLRRLEKKGYISHRSKGKAHVFSPKIHNKDVIGTAVTSLLDRLFGGDPIPLIQHLAENKNVTKEDIEHLKKLLDEQS